MQNPLAIGKGVKATKIVKAFFNIKTLDPYLGKFYVRQSFSLGSPERGLNQVLVQRAPRHTDLFSQLKYA